jgi:hypothetical protein
MQPDPNLARRLWQAIEPIHDVAYFAAEPTDALRDLGLRGFWMSYFAGRFAPLGAVGPDPVAAMAFGFARPMVARALPDAWDHARPEPIVAARIAAVTTALRRTLPPGTEADVEELVDLLARAVSSCAPDGRPLTAGWLGVAEPDDPLGRLWLHATVLREHRGDGHVNAAVALGLGGLDTTLTFVATGDLPRGVIQPNRGWSDEAWDASARRLEDRGLLGPDGRLTTSGVALRHELEATTDRLAAGPVERLGPAGVERTVELAAPLSRHLIDSGAIPVPNPIGAPRP